MILRLLLILFIIAQTPLYAQSFDGLYNDGGWKFIKKKKNFKIYSREMPGSDILGFKVEGHIEAPIIDIMATLRDVQLSTEWQPDLKEKRTIRNIDDSEAITYSRIDMPWPLDDRDYVIHNKLMVHKEKKLLFIISKSANIKGWEKRNKAVRAYIGYSNIGLRPVSKNRTYVEWTLFGEPKGNIPNWVVNFYQQSFPIGFFKAVADRANSKKIPVLPGLRRKLTELESVLKNQGRGTASGTSPVRIDVGAEVRSEK